VPQIITTRCSEVFLSDRIINTGMWPPRSPDLNPCNRFLLVEKVTDKLDGNNPRYEDSIKKKFRIRFRVCKSVHHHTFKWINQPDAALSQVYCLSFKYSSTCFGHPHAYHQKLINFSSSLWVTVGTWW
jgi:hypothetical protein